MIRSKYCFYWIFKNKTIPLPYSDPTRSIVITWVKNSETELMAEIYSKSQIRAIGKVLLIKLVRIPLKTQKGDEKWPLFVKKTQLFWWSALTTLDNNNDVLTDFYPFLSLNTLPHTSVGLTSCIYIVFSA